MPAYAYSSRSKVVRTTTRGAPGRATSVARPPPGSPAIEEVGDLFRVGKAYDVQVWSTPETRNSVSSVRQLLIDKPGGGHVRLGDVADVSVKPTPNVIER